MPEAWECDGRVFDSRDAAEEYAAKLADPPPIRRAGEPLRRSPSGGVGCGMVALVLAAGVLIVGGLTALGQMQVSGVVVLLVAALVGWRADARIRDLKRQVRRLERERDDLQHEVWDLEAEL